MSIFKIPPTQTEMFFRGLRQFTVKKFAFFKFIRTKLVSKGIESETNLASEPIQ